jgi:hypothetical protein
MTVKKGDERKEGKSPPPPPQPLSTRSSDISNYQFVAEVPVHREKDIPIKNQWGKNLQTNLQIY